MVLFESSEGRKRAPWTLQLVFSKILTFPYDQFWVEKHGCGGGSKGGWGQAPPSPCYLHQRQFPFKQTAMTVTEFVCMVSIFCIVLPQFVIAMTIIFYSETSIKRTPCRKRTLSRVPKWRSDISLYNKPLFSGHPY